MQISLSTTALRTITATAPETFRLPFETATGRKFTFTGWRLATREEDGVRVRVYFNKDQWFVVATRTPAPGGGFRYTVRSYSPQDFAALSAAPTTVARLQNAVIAAVRGG